MLPWIGGPTHDLNRLKGCQGASGHRFLNTGQVEAIDTSGQHVDISALFRHMRYRESHGFLALGTK